ncbi:SnoaL-like domain-containing protein [Mucilaginibacter ginsenosidivorans]|uniref:SnoaL-like domain-containing protein n=1 Tax=Mucilaginibacter ginsenosidivorans TaxID=398053 RepID=UPI0035E60EE4
MNTIKQIAFRLAQLCRERKFIEAYHELYSNKTESKGPRPRTLASKGLMTFLERIKQFVSKTDIHQIEISDPLFAGDYFAIGFQMDYNFVHEPRRYMDEICVCHVQNGKITGLPIFMK